MVSLVVAIFAMTLGNSVSLESCPHGLQQIADCSYGTVCVNYYCVCKLDSPPLEWCCPPYCGGNRCSSQCQNQATQCVENTTDATATGFPSTTALPNSNSTTISQASTSGADISGTPSSSTHSPETSQPTTPSPETPQPTIHNPETPQPTTSNPGNLSCGISNPNFPPAAAPPLIASLIGHGDLALRGEFPWTALIEIRDADDNLEGWCSGTLIDHKWILTAAHCVLNATCGVTDARKLWILVGHVDKSEGYGDYHQGNMTFAHPNYTCQNKSGPDLALIQLQESVRINNFINVPCMLGSEDSSKPADGTICYATGWGGSGSFAPPTMSTHLRKGSMKIAESGCNENEICATPAAGSVCPGDNGGPLVCKHQGAYALFGVTRNPDSDCGLTGSTSRFTPVQPHLKWINNNICLCLPN